jgi:hypothetical protein
VADASVDWLSAALIVAGTVAACVAAVLLYIGIFSDHDLAAWGWVVAIGLTAGAIGSLVWGARIWGRRRY